MRRIPSESKLPGMKAVREWTAPELSDQARAASVARRQDREETARAERAIENLEITIKRLKRKVFAK